MSIPRELLDQLLTGYLDDALSADERARVEQLLQSDPEIVNELSQLRMLRQSLKAVAEADSVIKLDAGFSDRVIGAAVARAQAEGLGDDHPLVRLVEQPSKTRAGSHVAPWRAASVLVAIAASIMIAVIVLRPAADDQMVAKNQTSPQVVQSDPSVTPEVMPESTSTETPAPEMIASSEPGGEASPETSPPESNALQTSDPVVNATPVTPPAEAIASSPKSSEAEMEAALRGRKNLVMVLDVQLTEQGRQTHAVDLAMEQASLARANKKEVTDELAAFAEEAVHPESGEEASVLYLQSTAKKLDQFYLLLQRDLEGIASVRLALPVDKMIFDVVDEVAVDARQVQHNEATLQLFSEDQSVDVLAQRLSELPYGRMNRNVTNRLPQWTSQSDDGVVVPSQMLVLVH